MADPADSEPKFPYQPMQADTDELAQQLLDNLVSNYNDGGAQFDARRAARQGPATRSMPHDPATLAAVRKVAGTERPPPPKPRRAPRDRATRRALRLKREGGSST